MAEEKTKNETTNTETTKKSKKESVSKPKKKEDVKNSAVKMVNEQVTETPVVEEQVATEEPTKVEEPVKKESKTKEKKTVAKSAKEKSVAKTEKKETKTTKKATKPETKAKQTKKTKDDTVSTETKAKKQKKEPYDVLMVEGYRQLKLYTYVFDDVESPKAIVLIVHGMMEHAGRYIEFAKFLNANGYIVVANDLRGHGHSAIDKKYGYGEKDIFSESVQDEIVILEKLKDAYNLPIYLFGHSYGSMLSQAIIQNTNIVEKCVLCGTANGSSGIMKSGSGLAKFLSFFKNENAGGGVIEKMCIKNYGKKFEHHNWLTRDNAVFEAYCKDEFCGGSFPFSFYKSMLTNMSKMNAGVNRIGRKKIFLIAGSEDPVGSKGKQVTALNKFYLKNNIDSRCKIYPECRHELLNELNKEEIYNDILEFYNN